MKTSQLPNQIPVVAMRNMVLFPGQTVPIVVGRETSKQGVSVALNSEGRWLLLLAQKEELDRDPTAKELYRLGTLAKIVSSEKNDKGSYTLTVQGVKRFEAISFEENGGLILASGQTIEDQIDLDEDTLATLTGSLRTLAREIFDLVPLPTDRLQATLDATKDPILLSWLISQHIEAETVKKQELLQTPSLKNRLLSLLEILVNIKENLSLQKEVQQKVHRKVGRQQREAMLREQIRALQEELGEGTDVAMGEYDEKIESAGMPEEVRKIAKEQQQRLESLGPQSPETNVIRNYLDLLIALPWSKSSEGELDLTRAREVLQKDHYGLEKIKKRILEHLAVMKLKKDKKGSILLFVGPPGVGKTSLGRSIAKAMGREFVRVSLGGVRDDAEIRGHRRTYVGALPGRIVDGIKRAGVNNPVFMLDEIDKLGRGWGGDPASSLLEVLDPEQNNKFLDHYLDVPFDLSNVIFIATANSLDTIPAPLLDRMETITLSGYTLNEKMHIAQDHLIPKQIEDHGMTAEQIHITHTALETTVQGYTREAGVRELNRLLGALVRASAEDVLNPDVPKPVTIDEKRVTAVLGLEKFEMDRALTDSIPGVVTGLAWTPVGGDILFIESSFMPGTGRLILTGQLGEVMKESAQIALSLVRSRFVDLSKTFAFDKNDIHLHVPAGAIPKDGPSAGAAIFLAMASLVTGRPVPGNLAMTGEITLRGAITPVGGIKEKVIAAHRSGIQRVVLPKRNERDLRDVPEEVKTALNFTFVEKVDEVLEFLSDPAAAQRGHMKCVGWPQVGLTNPRP